MLDSLGAESLSALELIELKQGEALASPGTVQRYAYFPISALISLEWENSPHCRTQIALVGPADVTGLMSLDDDDPRRRLTVAVAGHAVRCPLRIWPTIVGDYPAARLWLEQERRVYVCSASIAAACAANQSVSQRLARWILYAASLASRAELPIGHDDIARFLAVRRESVGLGLKHFARRGLIALSRRRIIVHRPGALARQACRCNAPSKLERERERERNAEA